MGVMHKVSFLTANCSADKGKCLQIENKSAHATIPPTDGRPGAAALKKAIKLKSRSESLSWRINGLPAPHVKAAVQG